jgi:hypothetical protein
MVSSEPANRETIIPPIIAVNTPMTGGNPEAPAIPKHRGNAISETKNPESISLFQFSFNPANPDFGICFFS